MHIIHSITNTVSANTIANCLLAIGASPLMTHAPEELEVINALSHALVLNIGTLDRKSVKSMQIAQNLALAAQKPIVLDPVGAGASKFRLETCLALLEQGISTIRGNASEILAITHQSTKNVGIDSQDPTSSAFNAANQLAKQYQCVVVVSGETDYITDGKQKQELAYGTPLFAKVTGMGCALTAIIAAFSAADHDRFMAAVNAVKLFTQCGERAAEKASGPGSFYLNLLDELYHAS